MHYFTDLGLPLFKSVTLALLTTLALIGCSNGGGSSNEPEVSPLSAPKWERGTYAHQDTYANICLTPRSEHTDPFTGEVLNEKPGTLMHEKMWLRSALHDFYLWTDQQRELDPSGLSLEANFMGRLTREDEYSGMTNEASYINQLTGAAGLSYGIRWTISINHAARAAFWKVADIIPESPLYGNVQRGDLLMYLDGMDATSLSNALDIHRAVQIPSESTSRDMTFLSESTDESYSVAAGAVTLTMDPVGIPVVVDDVAYLPFHDHNLAAEHHLVEAINDFKAQEVNDLILDLRYNVGGVLYIASQLAYMIAGAEATQDKIFQQNIHNDKHGLINPINGQSDVFPFFSTSTQNAPPQNQDLPTLNLSRLYVITGEETCSASEAIINALRGIDIEVIQIGETTCGKPYGSQPIYNCGTVYSPIMFRAANHKEYGEYTNGFKPVDGLIATPGEAEVPGCPMSEDFAAPLGSPDEILLHAALHYREHGSCPPSETRNTTGEQSPQQLHKPGTNAPTDQKTPAFMRGRMIVL